jgi:hypothetical protein
MVHLNLIFAAFWLAVGATLFIIKWIYPQAPDFRVAFLGVSLAWVAVMLAVYNLLRWSALYYVFRRRSMEPAAPARRLRHKDPSRSGSEPDPTFDFSDPQRKENEG